MYQNFTQDQLQVVDSQSREFSEFESLQGLGHGAQTLGRYQAQEAQLRFPRAPTKWPERLSWVSTTDRAQGRRCPGCAGAPGLGEMLGLQHQAQATSGGSPTVTAGTPPPQRHASQEDDTRLALPVPQGPFRSLIEGALCSRASF